jgi:hypothetical protein
LLNPISFDDRSVTDNTSELIRFTKSGNAADSLFKDKDCRLIMAGSTVNMTSPGLIYLAGTNPLGVYIKASGARHLPLLKLGGAKKLGGKNGGAKKLGGKNGGEKLFDGKLGGAKKLGGKNGGSNV